MERREEGQEESPVEREGLGEEELPLASTSNIWFEYDNQNDILYINFGTDLEDADDERLVDNDIVLRIKRGRVVSMTVFEFSKKIQRDIL